MALDEKPRAMKAQGPGVAHQPSLQPPASGDLEPAAAASSASFLPESIFASLQSSEVEGRHLAAQLDYTFWPFVQVGQILAHWMPVKVMCALRQSL